MTSRRGVTGLASPHPIGRMLPSLYEDDDFAQRFTAALDEVLAPAICVLDCLDGYVDPALTPPDFLRWLASSLGVEQDDSLPIDRLRFALRHAARAVRMEGTAQGITAAVAAVTGLRVRVSDSGGAMWSRSAFAEPPPAPAPVVEVRLDTRSDAVDVARVERVVAAAKPAHVPHAVVFAGDAVTTEGAA